MKTGFKDRARNAVAGAIQKGLLERKPCAECGSVKTEAHHSDYSEPLKVSWLCKAHHVAIHLKKFPKLSRFITIRANEDLWERVNIAKVKSRSSIERICTDALVRYLDSEDLPNVST